MLLYYAGEGQWCFTDFFDGKDIPFTERTRESGFFELGKINTDEIKFLKKTTITYLKPTDKHDDGVDVPFIPDLGVLDIPFFNLIKPINITIDDIFKENIEVAKDIGAESQVSRTLEETITKAEGERQSQLYIFIWRVHQFLSEKKKPTAQEVWNEIQYRYKVHDNSEIIQEVDGKLILWCSGYGNEQKQSRSTFDKTLSNIRKTPPF